MSARIRGERITVNEDSLMLPRARFRLATLLVMMIPLGVVCLHLRWWLDVPPELKWEPYSPQLVEQELAKGRVVVVHFTGMWDPNCLYTLRGFNHSDQLREYVHQRPITLAFGDWTDESPVITNALNQLSIKTVPATVVFRPGGSKPEVMPDIITAAQLIAELEK